MSAGEIKVVLVGDSGVYFDYVQTAITNFIQGAGKTSIVLRLSRGKFVDNVGATIGASFIKHTMFVEDFSFKIPL